MAKIGEGMPYVAEVLKAGPGGMVDVQNAAMAAVASDLDDLINKYYSMDWYLVAAGMELTAKALKSHLDPLSLKLEESLVRRCVSMSAVYKEGGGVTLRAA